jgi:hypothetical protein
MCDARSAPSGRMRQYFSDSNWKLLLSDTASDAFCQFADSFHKVRARNRVRFTSVNLNAI